MNFACIFFARQCSIQEDNRTLFILTLCFLCYIIDWRMSIISLWLWVLETQHGITIKWNILCNESYLYKNCASLLHTKVRERKKRKQKYSTRSVFTNISTFFKPLRLKNKNFNGSITSSVPKTIIYQTNIENLTQFVKQRYLTTQQNQTYHVMIRKKKKKKKKN